jgi:hypothetical protein|tara:strand:+ start:412 stop:576 length:165 start_codon:yes stop_codon:yes gene_type:complete
MTNERIISKVKKYLQTSDGRESKNLLKYVEILEEARDIHEPIEAEGRVVNNTSS